MTNRMLTDEQRLALIREAWEAAGKDWHEATNLWSVCADLDWLLQLAAALALKQASDSSEKTT